ncbi:MAG: 4Fe-4S binding protein [Gammaproteobacteria bacterium]|nr:4Fe-4S binding protein [Gammaproteobacteria bacterium]
MSAVAGVSPDPSVRTSRVVRCQARVLRRRSLTHDTVELVLGRLPGSPPLLGRAGQFAVLTAPGLDRPRAYSFARDPAQEAPGEHTFVIRLVPGGAMSGWLAGGDRIGEIVELAGPLGRFGLDDHAGAMIFVAGGSGMSVTRALLQAAVRRQVPRDAVVLHGARTAADLYAGAELAQLAAGWHPGARCAVAEVLSDEPDDSAWAGPRGLVTDYLRDAVLTDLHLNIANASAWLCGPAPMIAAADTVLRAAGVAPSRIHRDVFEDASSPAPVIDNRRCVLCDECLLVRPVDGCIVESSGFEVAVDGGVAGPCALVPGATSGLYYNSLVIDPERCIRCSACINACPHGAIDPGYPRRTETLRQPA